ncbi:MAG TPA: cell division protein ZapA [Saprospiraceae bacterium]|nr:cell division protein ZapA [Saprospiraceae bacterium]
MEENVKTSIKIAGRVYPLFIRNDEMTQVRLLEKQINDTSNNIQIQYAISDKFDCLAMTLLSLLSEKQPNGDANSQNNLVDIVSKIETLLARSAASY